MSFLVYKSSCQGREKAGYFVLIILWLSVFCASLCLWSVIIVAFPGHIHVFHICFGCSK